MRIAVVGIALLALGASSAQAATKPVSAGPSPSDLTALKLGAIPGDVELDLFGRRTITVRAGDRVRWTINGRHTVTFLNGYRRPGQLVTDLKDRLEGFKDDTGTPFWFNGQATVLGNTAVTQARGGSTFSRTRIFNSGTSARHYTLRFPRRGRFTYVCLLHPDMAGTVVVKRRHQKVPKAAADKKQRRKELRRVVVSALAAEKATTPRSAQAGSRVIQAGNDGANFAIHKYFPSAGSVPVGVPVTLRVSPHSNADHTFTFGPADVLKTLQANLTSRRSATRLEYNAQAILASDPSPPPYGPTLHGNGFFNTGLLDTGALGDSAVPLASSATVFFATPGTYTFQCLIHPDMTGTVGVTP